MAVSSDYLVYVVEQFAAFAKVTTRRMFGAVGLYGDGLFFAIVDDDTLYLKVDDSNRGDFVARGYAAFRPYKDDPTLSMNYFQLPEDILEDADELKVWTRKSLAVAASASAAKAQRTRLKGKSGNKSFKGPPKSRPAAK